ncbi:serine hydrolase domain-containing protein [Rhodanobacter sp. Si-c]|uniref:Serine hydrolase domain-containing protein n=1 Tax=Rhodanobacter lycopersici TaxID=3162487 RepID=A0ABV3QAC8_9GAMM
MLLLGLVLCAPSVRAECAMCAEVAAQAQAEGFNGVILVAEHGRTVYAKAFGLAHAEPRELMRLDTRFDAGSISKWVAAIVVLQLVDHGKLSLDAPISRYLPEYRADNGARLTLRDLMRHASGLPNLVDEAYKRDRSLKRVPLPMDEAIRRYASGDLTFAPGSAWEYSHSNWILVQAIVERVSGRPYAEQARQALLLPLGMQHSDVLGGEPAGRGDALGYAGAPQTAQRRETVCAGYMLAACGFHVDAADLVTLLEAVAQGRVLSPWATRMLFTVQMPAQHYALGGRVRRVETGGVERELVDEYGSDGAFRVSARRTSADGHAVVVMNNSGADHLWIGDLAQRLMDASYR